MRHARPGHTGPGPPLRHPHSTPHCHFGGGFFLPPSHRRRPTIRRLPVRHVQWAATMDRMGRPRGARCASRRCIALRPAGGGTWRGGRGRRRGSPPEEWPPQQGALTRVDQGHESPRAWGGGGAPPAGGTEDPGPPQEVCGPRANQVVRQGAGRRGGVFHAASPSGASPAALATAAPCRRLPSSSLDEERNTGCVAAAAGSARQEHQCHRRTPRTGRAARTDPTLEPPPPPSSSTKSAFTARVRRQHCHVTGQSRTRECERGGGHRKLRVWRRLPPLL